MTSIHQVRSELESRTELTFYLLYRVARLSKRGRYRAGRIVLSNGSQLKVDMELFCQAGLHGDTIGVSNGGTTRLCALRSRLISRGVASYVQSGIRKTQSPGFWKRRKQTVKAYDSLQGREHLMWSVACIWIMYRYSIT